MTDLEQRMREAIARYNDLDPVDRALADDDQRRSFLRGQGVVDPGPLVLAQEVRRLRSLVTDLTSPRTMSTAPRDETPVLLYDCRHGWVQAYFVKGEWSCSGPDTPREYSGSVWVCGDDAWQIEVEERGPDCPDGPYDDGSALAWLPCPKSVESPIREPTV